MTHKLSKTSSQIQARNITIDNLSSGQRIDNYLIKTLYKVPKSHIYRLLRTGQIRVNKGRKKPDYKLKPGDEVRLPPIKSEERRRVTVPRSVTDRIGRRVVFENDDIILLNKPANLSVHAGSGLVFGIIDALRQHRSDQSLELVHRLDRDTSGCLLIAKNREALLMCQDAFRQNRVEKVYLALTVGIWKRKTLTRNAALKKNRLRSGERMVEESAQGAAALSHFTVLEQYPDTALVQVRIETGRTHQIRVHLSSLGHPVVGDNKYGDKRINRLAHAAGLKRMYLHAESLSFKARTIDYRLYAQPGETWRNEIRLLETQPLGSHPGRREKN